MFGNIKQVYILFLKKSQDFRMFRGLNNAVQYKLRPKNLCFTKVEQMHFIKIQNYKRKEKQKVKPKL